MPSFEANMVKKEDLFDHLIAQLGMLKLNDAERRVGACSSSATWMTTAT